AFDGGAAGQQIVGCIYADLKIVAGAVDDEIEGAGQRLDLAVGAKVDGSRDITSGDAGEGGDAVGLDLDGAIVSHFRDLADQRGGQSLPGEERLGKPDRFPRIPGAIDIERDAVAERLGDVRALRG